MTNLRKLEVKLGQSTLLRRCGHADELRTYQRDGFDSAEVRTPADVAERLANVADTIESAVLRAWPTGEGRSPLGSRAIEWADGKLKSAGYWRNSGHGPSFMMAKAETVEQLKAVLAEKGI